MVLIVIVSLCSLSFVTVGQLLLTDLINSRNFSEARNLSRVKAHYCQMPESYAGYITVEKQLKHHLFFWLFPSFHKVNTSPLVIWLQGGPGRSSMEGLLWENGPLQIVDGQNLKVQCKARETSWTEAMSMLYIDSPVGTGFSYAENETAVKRIGQSQIAKDLSGFLHQFYILFPEFKSNDLYIGGEGYAAKYVISFAHRLHRNHYKHSKLPFSGIYLSGPFFAPEIQIKSSLDLLFAVGAISYQELLSHRKEADTFFNWDRKNKNVQDEQMLDALMKSLRPGNPSDNFALKHYKNFGVTQKLVNADLKPYLNVGGRNFNFYDDKLSQRLIQDFRFSSKLQLAKLLQYYKVLVFSGEFDALFSPSMVDFGLMSTPWSSQRDFNISDRTEWRQQRKLLGYYTHIDRLCRVIIEGAGHLTSFDKPKTTLDMMNQFMQHGCIH
ncbi:venom serine carboxypeptidase-like [Biomphalaria glabrata]|uniref:Venom serine carboxypeptidase-like n=1 Tax=Biomphalaria glabrata TaxID=6526 RepID=A0A9W2YE35_BIOGL|nr:venom serine carboxypeptidase-like [Biomphalaria glabrata]